MRKRNYGFMGSMVLASFVMGCGGEDAATTPGVDPEVDTGTVKLDTGAPKVDSSSPDTTTTPDTETPPDTESPDTGVADTTVADTTVADTTVADTAVADTKVADTIAVDSAVVDTTILDTAAPDTAALDTAVADSAVADSAGADVGETSAAKTATVWVLRLGTGTVVATGAAAPLFLDPVTLTYTGTTGAGVVGTAVVIPSTGTSALTLPVSNSIGSLSRSPDGKRVSFAAYNAAAGTAAIADATPATIKRHGVAVVSTGTVSSLELGANANANGNSIRGAVTVDGTAFWTASEDKGIAYTATAGTTTSFGNANLRWPMIVDGQLYVTSGSTSGTPGRGLLQVGAGLPTATATLTLVPGTGAATGTGNVSPYGAFAIDTDGAGGIDTLYICDDRATASGGGIQRWKLETGTWNLKATHTGGFSGCRGVTGFVDGTNVHLFVVTTETAARLVWMVDTVAGSAAITASTILATAATNDTYRGVALAPVP